MTTGPQDPAARGRDQFRAGHADREQVIETLKDAFVHGRLTRDELDARVGQALVARTYADLSALTTDIPPREAALTADIPRREAMLTADIPAGQAAARSARPAAVGRRRPLARATAQSGSCLITATAAMWAHHLADPGATTTPYSSFATPLFLIAVFAVLTALGFLVFGVSASLEQRQSRRELPPPPGPDSHAPSSGDPRGSTSPDPPPPGRRHDQDRADLRAHESRPHRHIPARAGRLCGVRPAPGAV